MTNPSQPIDGRRTTFSYTFNNDALSVVRDQRYGVNAQYSKKRTAGGGIVQTMGAFSFDNPVHISSFDPPGSTPIVAGQTPAVTPKPKVVGFEPIKSALRSSLRPKLKSPVPAVTSPSPSNHLVPPAVNVPPAYNGKTKAQWLDYSTKADHSAATQLLNQNRALTSMIDAVEHIIERYGKDASGKHKKLSSSVVCNLAEYLTDECAQSPPQEASESSKQAASIVLEMDKYAARYTLVPRVDSAYTHGPDRFDAKHMWGLIGTPFRSEHPEVTTYMVEAEGKTMSLAEYINGWEGEVGGRSVGLAKYIQTVHDIMARRAYEDKTRANQETVAGMAVAILEARGDAHKIAEIHAWPEQA